MFNEKTYARGCLTELEDRKKDAEARSRVLSETLSVKVTFYQKRIDLKEVALIVSDLEKNQLELDEINAEILKIKEKFQL